MVRLPRFFGKKRGNRRSVSQAWGSLGEAGFYLVLLAAGLIYATVLVLGIAWPEWRHGLGTPPKPPQASSATGIWLWLLNLFLPTALLAIGGAGIVRMLAGLGKSEEHRAAAATLPDFLEPMAGAIEEPGYPTVPTCDNFTNSPGTKLEYRLPIESPEHWTLLGLGIFALLWNAVLIVLAVNAGIDLAGGRAQWLLLSLVAVFAGVGLASIGLFARAAINAAGAGPTQLEISSLPMRPGGRYELFISQSGSGTFSSLSISLEQEEQATFRQGTDTRTERRIVARREVANWQGIELSPASRFEAAFVVSLPETAMHSFTSPHNHIDWRFVVRGEPHRRPPFVRAFPVVVLPARAPSTVGSARLVAASSGP